jgi:hypothetical protein
MVLKLDAHRAKPPANHPQCAAAGAYVNLHPYGTRAFVWVLTALGIEGPMIFTPLYDTGPVLAPAALHAAAE